MEQFGRIFFAITLRCANCRAISQLDIWPLYPVTFIALASWMVIFGIVTGLREARRASVILWLALLIPAVALVGIMVIGAIVLYLPVLLVKMFYFALTFRWRRVCGSCNSRCISIYDLGVADFRTLVWQAVQPPV